MTADAEHIIALTAQGHSVTRIAELAGCTTRTVQRVRARRGLTQPLPDNAGQRVSPERLERARLMIDDEASHREISVTLGIKPVTLARHFPGTGWTPEQAAEGVRMAKAFERLPDRLVRS